MSHPETGLGARPLDEQMATLHDRLRDMSQVAESLVEKSVRALLTRDTVIAEAVVAGDEELDSLENDVEQLAVSVIARQQPVARDLRELISAIKVSSDLERVGDHAVNIALSAQRLSTMSHSLRPPPEISSMAQSARRMLGNAIDALLRGDGQLGRAVGRADDEVDDLHDSVFRIVLTHMMEAPHTITQGIEILLVSRNLERVADLATNIGEDAVFLAEGRQIKHRHDERVLGAET